VPIYTAFPTASKWNELDIYLGAGGRVVRPLCQRKDHQQQILQKNTPCFAIIELAYIVEVSE
jgi:hypothetical protein